MSRLVRLTSRWGRSRRPPRKRRSLPLFARGSRTVRWSRRIRSSRSPQVCPAPSRRIERSRSPGPVHELAGRRTARPPPPSGAGPRYSRAARRPWSSGHPPRPLPAARQQRAPLMATCSALPGPAASAACWASTCRSTRHPRLSRVVGGPRVVALLLGRAPYRVRVSRPLRCEPGVHQVAGASAAGLRRPQIGSGWRSGCWFPAPDNGGGPRSCSPGGIAGRVAN